MLAFSAAFLASFDVFDKLLTAEVSMQVASQIRGCPLDQYVNVTPSDLFPLLRFKSAGSNDVRTLTLTLTLTYPHSSV